MSSTTSDAIAKLAQNDVPSDAITATTTMESIQQHVQMRRITGFDLFRNQEQDRLKLEAGTTFKLTTQMPLIAAKWKNMSEDDRMRFKSSAKERGMVPASARKQKRARRENTQQLNGVQKKRRKERDPNVPKRPLSAFIFFSCERRKSLVVEQPTMKPTECLKHMGTEWKELTDRQHYLALAAIDKIRYTNEIVTHNTK